MNIVFKYQNLEQFLTKLEAFRSESQYKDEDEEEVDEQNDVLIVERFGSVLRKCIQRLTHLFIDLKNTYL